MSLTIYGVIFLIALTPTLLFSIWVRKRPWELKDKISAWDLFIKTLGIAGAIILGLASFDRFLDQRQQELIKDQIEKNQARTEAFNQAIHTSSTIATATEL